MPVALTAACLLVLVQAPADEARPELLPGLFIYMKSDGLPGQPNLDAKGNGAGPSRQELLVTEDRLSLRDTRSQLTYLFRLDLDPVRFWELSPGLDQYRDARRHEEIQDSRTRFEKQLITAQRKRLSTDEFERFLKRNHLKANASREVKLQVTEAAGNMLGYPYKHYLVLENGRVIVDAKVTEDLGLTIPFFEFYRRIGAFSDEVLEKLRGIEGVPLEATFTVVTDMLNHVIHTEVTDVTKQRLLPSYFELPPGAVEVKDTPPIVECYWLDCRTRVETAAPPDKFVKDLRIHYFCSKKCGKLFRKERRRRLEEGAIKNPKKGTTPLPEKKKPDKDSGKKTGDKKK